MSSAWENGSAAKAPRRQGERSGGKIDSLKSFLDRDSRQRPHHRLPWRLGALAANLGLFVIFAPLGSAEVVSAGVLGNSGGCDAALVRCGSPVPTLGVVVDRWKTLWERGGKGVLHRLAVDGRMLAQFPLPPGNSQRDRAVIAGDTLVLLLDERLYRLAIDAAAGTAPTPITLPGKVDALAPTAWQGRVLIATGGALAWLDPQSGGTTAAGPVGERVDGIEADAQGIA